MYSLHYSLQQDFNLSHYLAWCHFWPLWCPSRDMFLLVFFFFFFYISFKFIYFVWFIFDWFHFNFKLWNWKIACSRRDILRYNADMPCVIRGLLYFAAKSNMAAAVQWRSDWDLKLRLESLVKRGYQRSEILHVMKKDFSQYTWGCIKNLDRRRSQWNPSILKQVIQACRTTSMDGALLQSSSGISTLLSGPILAYFCEEPLPLRTNVVL